MFERIYWLYQELKNSSYPSKKQYIETFEVSESTFKRDIDFFRDRLRAPIKYDLNRNGYYLTDEAFEIPSFWFGRNLLFAMLGICEQFRKISFKEPDEIKALRENIESHLKNINKLILKLVSFENVEWYLFDNKYFDTVLDAMLEKRCLKITYHTAHSNEIADRIVEPYRLHNYMGSWHMISFCRYRSEPRNFLLGRIQEIKILDEYFTSPKFDADEYIKGSFGIYKGTDIQKVVLKFSLYISRFIRDEFWHQDQIMSENEDGEITLTLKVADFTEIKRYILKYGSQVEVLEPAELRMQVLEEAEKIMEIYRRKK